jgi:hypothetical protein
VPPCTPSYLPLTASKSYKHAPESNHVLNATDSSISHQEEKLQGPKPITEGLRGTKGLPKGANSYGNGASVLGSLQLRNCSEYSTKGKQANKQMDKKTGK